MQISNYKAHTNNVDVKYCTSWCAHRSTTGFSISAILGSLVSLLHETQFRRDREPSGSSVITSYLGTRDTSHAWNSHKRLALPLLRCYSLRPHLPPQRLASVVSFDILVFTVGPACFRITPQGHSHYHTQFSRTFHNCFNEVVVEGWVASHLLNRLSYAF